MYRLFCATKIATPEATYLISFEIHCDVVLSRGYQDREFALLDNRVIVFKLLLKSYPWYIHLRGRLARDLMIKNLMTYQWDNQCREEILAALPTLTVSISHFCEIIYQLGLEHHSLQMQRI